MGPINWLTETEDRNLSALIIHFEQFHQITGVIFEVSIEGSAIRNTDYYIWNDDISRFDSHLWISFLRVQIGFLNHVLTNPRIYVVFGVPAREQGFPKGSQRCSLLARLFAVEVYGITHES